jgi:hypothetical protein
VCEKDCRTVDRIVCAQPSTSARTRVSGTWVWGPPKSVNSTRSLYPIPALSIACQTARWSWAIISSRMTNSSDRRENVASALCRRGLDFTDAANHHSLELKVYICPIEVGHEKHPEVEIYSRQIASATITEQVPNPRSFVLSGLASAPFGLPSGISRVTFGLLGLPAAVKRFRGLGHLAWVDMMRCDCAASKQITDKIWTMNHYDDMARLPDLSLYWMLSIFQAAWDKLVPAIKAEKMTYLGSGPPDKPGQYWTRFIDRHHGLNRAFWIRNTSITPSTPAASVDQFMSAIAIDAFVASQALLDWVTNDREPPGGVAEPKEPLGGVSAKLPELKTHDRQAWQLATLHGMTQCKIAAALNQEHRTTYTQGQVSRMIRRAKIHAEANGLIKKVAGPIDRPRTVDPRRLELGARVDMRKPRPSDMARANDDDE